MICTTIEQSKELMGLGLNPETADMHWFSNWSNKLDLGIVPYKDVRLPKYIKDGNKEAFILPAWSLGALIDLIHTATFLQKVDGACHGCIEIDNDDLIDEAHRDFGSSTTKSIKADNLFDVVFSLMVWYLTNKKK